MLRLPLVLAPGLFIEMIDHRCRNPQNSPTPARVGIEINQPDRAAYPKRVMSSSVESGNWWHSLSPVPIYGEDMA